MSFWGKVFNIVGFDGEEIKKKPKKVKHDKDAKYILKNEAYLQSTVRTKLISNIEMLQNTIEELSTLKKIIFDFSEYDGDKYRAIDFLSGAIFALDGDIRLTEDKNFFCSIETEEEL